MEKKASVDPTIGKILIWEKAPKDIANPDPQHHIYGQRPEVMYWPAAPNILDELAEGAGDLALHAQRIVLIHVLLEVVVLKVLGDGGGVGQPLQFRLYSTGVLGTGIQTYCGVYVCLSDLKNWIYAIPLTSFFLAILRVLAGFAF